MLRSLFFGLLATTAVLLTACSGSSNMNEATFYGIWTRGTGPGDTLWFFRQSGKNILRYNMTSSAHFTNYTEIEYTVKNEVLQITAMAYPMHPLPASSSGFMAADSFTWIEPCKEFRMLGNQLYPYLNAYPLYMNFRKQ